ncbi:MAG: sugar kinase [Pyrinomonadaceae bacterium]
MSCTNKMRLPFYLINNKTFDCVGFGVNAVDYLGPVTEYPQFDTKTRLMNYVQAAGGQTASAIVALQRLGMKTAYAGRFGDDREGKLGLQSLRDEGVEVSFCEFIEGAKTQIALIIIDARNGERTIIWDRDEKLNFRAEDAPRTFGSLGRVLHLDAHEPAACIVVAREARANDTIISSDIDDIYENLPELLPLIDVLVTSKDVPKRLTGIDNLRAALIETHARYGCVITGVTLGESGAIVFCEGQFIETPAFKVEARDTTGAGDAFHAGFIYGMLKDESIEGCLSIGCAVAALNCRGLGARAGLPTMNELEEWLRNAG